MEYAARRDEPGKTAAGVMAVLVHLAFFAMLVLGVSWQRRPPEGVTVELWRELPPEPVKVAPPEPKLEPKPEPKPKPKIEPPPQPKVELKPKPEPKPVEKPDIALEKEKQEKVRREREEREREKAKAETLKREQEKAEALRREEAIKAEKQKIAALERERAAKEKQLAEDRKALEEDARRMAQAAVAANKKLIDEYRSRIEARIKRYLVAEACKPLGSIVVPLHVALFPDGTTRNPPRTERSSGSAACDEAMLRAVLRAQPLPLPDDPVARREFAELTLNFRPND